MRKAKILGEDGVPLQTTRQRKRSYLDGSFKLKKDGLRNEDLASLGAKIANLGLEQLDLLARSAAPHFQEAIDYRVKVDFVLVRHCKYSSILTSLRLWRTQKKKKKTELLVVTGRSQAVRDRTGKKTASALENRSDDALLGAGCREWTITDELVKLETQNLG